MGIIVCATRGGESSHKAQDEAIGLAKKTGDTLVFLFVVDADFMRETTEISRISGAENEVQRMGEFILLMAQERAREKGIAAEVVCRRGSVVREVIKEVIEEFKANTLVLGHPLPRDAAESRYHPDELREFARRIEEDTGVRVVIVE